MAKHRYVVPFVLVASRISPLSTLDLERGTVFEQTVLLGHNAGSRQGPSILKQRKHEEKIPAAYSADEFDESDGTTGIGLTTTRVTLTGSQSRKMKVFTPLNQQIV